MNRIPSHIGVIPDGNRRWAAGQGLAKEAGYEKGLNPGLELYGLCKELGVKELTFYGFTQDNTKRPSIQREAFQKSCVDAVEMLSKEDAELLVIGNDSSNLFPKQLIPYRKRTKFGEGRLKVNFLVNYGWQWDLSHGLSQEVKKNSSSNENIMTNIASADISRVDLIIRWGGRRRLSGFLPVQSIYSDLYVVDAYWPDFKPQHLYDALEWYNQQDVTLGG
ncbi:Di-trans-poly-cis-decaprenylcistransferase [Alkaliphilus metalliredigens QYMF]|uniref:Di-trans-poly-cis-decaprenylcistransferase n=1 Tax=Alkaliphilus metalliredigens (strain QYMF) TaxID=293826 RepID=A6TMM6_ALKMQ|nr:polyprenyl diphosphate synthase [Alkaliphilus metalliredigens]ABR47444.1 Di-trans-poly-cis-decaprenylcistransferase [Alkaliphilus metalliredigens QYMF]